MENRLKNGEPEIQTLTNNRHADVIELDYYALCVRLLENWKLLAIFSLLGALLAGIYTHFAVTPMYKTTAKLYMLSDSSSLINMSDLQLSNQLAGDYLEVFNVWKVHDEVIERLNLPYTRGQISGMISVSNPSDTRILCITATSADPEEAQSIANTYADVAKDYIATQMAAPTPSVWEEALLPEAPSSPNMQKNVMTGFMAGFFLIALIIILQFILDDYIRTPEDIEKYVQLPTLGSTMLQDYRGTKKNSKRRRNRK